MRSAAPRLPELLRPVLRPQEYEVTVVRSEAGTSNRLTSLPSLSLERRRPQIGSPSVVVEPTVCYQVFLGFGGSFTEASAEVFKQLGPAQQDHVIDAYFREDTGLGYRLGRIHMNSCDFSRGDWSCCESEDMELRTFSVERYRDSILPLLRRAAQVVPGRGRLSLIASPWSPPAWMKDSGRMCLGGKLRPECRAAWAKHFVLFAQALEEEGFPLWAFTVQNEPEAITPWENCLFSAEAERDFLRDHLGPTLKAAGLSHVKLIVHDHNRDSMFQRARTLLSDPAASRFIWGLGFHWYGDSRFEAWPDKSGQVCFDNVRRVHDLKPALHLIMTEACQESSPRLGDWRVGERYGESIIKDLNNWTEGWVDWNLILDAEGGPNHVGNHCAALIHADLATGELLFQPSYYYMGQFSRYVRPGARRLACASNRDALEVTAFLNPDGTLVTIVMNQTEKPIAFWLSRGGNESAKSQAPAHSITTYTMQAGLAQPSSSL